MIIRKCISTTNINDVITAFIADMATAGYTATNNISNNEGNVKFYYTQNEWIELEVSSSGYFSIYVKGNSFSSSIISAFNSYYVRYTIVKTGNSFALAFNGVNSNGDEDKYTNKLELFVTKIGNNTLSFDRNSYYLNSEMFSLSGEEKTLNSTYNWAQLVPFALPSLGGKSDEVFWIRFAPQEKIEATINSQKYILGEYLAIKG